jgi:hypothetical protein
MKYIVGENASFIANSRIYGPGEEIDSELFKFPKTIEAALASGKLKAAQDNPDVDTGGGDTNFTAKQRKAMEKAAIDSGLGNPEEVKNLSDKDLAEILTAAGVVV